MSIMAIKEHDWDRKGHIESDSIFADYEDDNEGKEGYSDDHFDAYNDNDIADEPASVGRRRKVPYNETGVLEVAGAWVAQ